MSETLPIVMTTAGLQPLAPADILARLIANVAATNPGYTANLPGSLIEDISSTDVAAIALCDSALVDLVNSLTPYGANQFLLAELGALYGAIPGVDTNTSVFVVFTGPPGYVIAQGFTVSDGTHQYRIVDGGIIGAGGTTVPLFALATVAGTWAVPSGTVTQRVTSVPSSISLTFTNPLDGIPSPGPQTVESYRSQVLQAGLAASMGMTRYLRTLLDNVSGVQPRLVSPIQVNGGGWEILVGGGDPYEVAYAIFASLFDISTLVGSTIRVLGITNANPGVVTTDLNHGYADGQVINIAGAVGISGVNNTPLTVTVITGTTFSIGIDTTSSGTWTSGGVVTPNFRNQVVTVVDYPDVYEVPFVVPPLQTVAITLTWNTNSINPVSPTAMAQAGGPALVDYVNSIVAGRPMNLFELQNAFQIATANILPTTQLTRMVFAVSIDGVGVSPSSGTGIIQGDPESFFQTDLTQITITQG